jgi:hypothetical protein
MRLVGHVARIGKKRDAYKVLVGGDHSEDIGVDGRKTLKRIIGKWGLGMWIGLIWLIIGIGCIIL